MNSSTDPRPVVILKPEPQAAGRIFTDQTMQALRNGDALLALAFCDLENFDDAEPFVQRGRELSAEDDLVSQAQLRMARARILSHRRNHEEALVTIDEAIAINESTDYLAFIAESHEIRAVVLLADGRVDEARAEFEQAAELYERKGIVPWARRVRRALEGFAHPSP